MTLTERLAAMRVAPPYTLSDEQKRILQAAIDDQRRTGARARVVRVGTAAPAFELSDQDGAKHSLESLSSNGPAVLSFYRGVWCPFCNEDLKMLQENVENIQALGATLVAISPQQPANSRKAVRNLNLTFPLLFDAENRTAETYGLKFRVVDSVKEVYLSLSLDLAKLNGDESWTLPMPARIVVDQRGIVRYAESDPDYKIRPEADEMLAVLQELQVTP